MQTLLAEFGQEILFRNQVGNQQTSLNVFLKLKKRINRQNSIPISSSVHAEFTLQSGDLI